MLINKKKIYINTKQKKKPFFYFLTMSSTGSTPKSGRQDTRMRQLKKLLDILQSPEEDTVTSNLSGGGSATRVLSGGEEDMMNLHLSVLKKHFSPQQVRSFTNMDSNNTVPKYLEPTHRQRLNVTSEMLTGILTPEQTREFQHTKLVDLTNMSPAQVNAFADLSMGYVMGNVLNKEQFSRWVNRKDLNLSYNQAKVLQPLLNDLYASNLRTDNRAFSSNLNHIGSLTQVPMSNFLAEPVIRGGSQTNTKKTATSPASGVNKVANIKDLISRIEQTIQNIQ